MPESPAPRSNWRSPPPGPSHRSGALPYGASASGTSALIPHLPVAHDEGVDDHRLRRGKQADGALAWKLALAVQKRLVPVETLEAGWPHPPPAAPSCARRWPMSRRAPTRRPGRYVRDVSEPIACRPAIRQSASRVNGGSVHDNDYADSGSSSRSMGVGPRVGQPDQDSRRDRRLGGASRFTNRVFWPDVAVTVCATAAESRCAPARQGLDRSTDDLRPARMRGRGLAATAAWVSG